jgi:4a-hydroxytetrahydrobiopterin dehydratase
LPGDALGGLLDELGGSWRLVDGKRLEKEYAFPDFRSGFEFVKRVGEMSEAEDHHGDLFLAWGKVRLTVWTHTVNGLTESDFVWAAKADALLEGPAG